MKTVISYLAGIPPKNKNQEKEEVLRRFIEGVNKVGDSGKLNSNKYWTLSDVAVLQGYVHQNSEKTPHLMLRRSVLDSQKKHGKHTVIIDSNLFLYATPGNPSHYLRYSLDGVFPTTGNYFNSQVDPYRWKSISTKLNISLKDWRIKGKHIVICLQRNGGWSMQGLDVLQWCNTTIQTLRKYTDRPIIIRGHPGDKKTQKILRFNYPDVSVSKNLSLKDDLKNSWATITYNSSPGVASAIEGIPVFVTDPNPNLSQAFDVCNTDISKIENPQVYDRKSWIEKISMSHWNFEELSTGEAWAHMRNFV